MTACAVVPVPRALPVAVRSGGYRRGSWRDRTLGWRRNSLRRRRNCGLNLYRLCSCLTLVPLARCGLSGRLGLASLAVSWSLGLCHRDRRIDGNRRLRRRCGYGGATSLGVAVAISLSAIASIDAALRWLSRLTRGDRDSLYRWSSGWCLLDARLPRDGALRRGSGGGRSGLRGRHGGLRRCICRGCDGLR